MDFGEAANQARRCLEVDDAVVLGAAADFVLVLLRNAVHQHPLLAADHIGGNLCRHLQDTRLQAGEAGFLHVHRDAVGHGSGGRAGARAVNKTERGVVEHILNQLHRRLKILVFLAGETDDEIRRKTDIRADFPQPCQLLLIFRCLVTALH